MKISNRKKSGIIAGSSNGNAERVGPADYKTDKEDKANG